MVLGELGGREFDLRKITDHLSQVGLPVFFPIGIKHLKDVEFQHRPIQLNQVAVNRQLQLNLRVALIQLGIGKNHRLLQVDEHQAGQRILAGGRGEELLNLGGSPAHHQRKVITGRVDLPPLQNLPIFLQNSRDLGKNALGIKVVLEIAAPDQLF